jgi:hypothetical protein
MGSGGDWWTVGKGVLAGYAVTAVVIVAADGIAWVLSRRAPERVLAPAALVAALAGGVTSRAVGGERSSLLLTGFGTCGALACALLAQEEEPAWFLVWNTFAVLTCVPLGAYWLAPKLLK